MLRIDQTRHAYIILSIMISNLAESSANMLFRFIKSEITQIVLFFEFNLRLFNTEINFSQLSLL